MVNHQLVCRSQKCAFLELVIVTIFVTSFAALSCHNPSSAAGSKPRRPRLCMYTNCHIRLTDICSFCTYMLELTSVISEVTVAETRSFL